MKKYLIFSKADPKSYQNCRAYLAEIELIEDPNYPKFKAVYSKYSSEDIPEGVYPREVLIPEYDENGKVKLSVKLCKAIQEIIEFQPCYISKIIAYAASKPIDLNINNINKTAMLNPITKNRVYTKLAKDDKKYYDKRINDKEEFFFPKMFTEYINSFYFISKNDETALKHFRNVMKTISLSDDYVRVNSFRAMNYDTILEDKYIIYNPHAKSIHNLDRIINHSNQKLNGPEYKLMAWKAHDKLDIDKKTIMPANLIDLFDNEYTSSIAILNPIIKKYFLGFDALYKKDWAKVKEYFETDSIGSNIDYSEFFDIYPVPLSDLHSFIGSYYYKNFDLRQNFPNITDEEFINNPEWQILTDNKNNIFFSKCGNLFSSKFKYYEVGSKKSGDIKSFSNKISNLAANKERNAWKKNEIFNKEGK